MYVHMFSSSIQTLLQIKKESNFVIKCSLIDSPSPFLYLSFPLYPPPLFFTHFSLLTFSPPSTSLSLFWWPRTWILRGRSPHDPHSNVPIFEISPFMDEILATHPGANTMVKIARFRGGGRGAFVMVDWWLGVRNKNISDIKTPLNYLTYKRIITHIGWR